MSQQLIEGVDYSIENGLFVLSAVFLSRRGYCCKNICRNCPFGNSPADRENRNGHKHPEAEPADGSLLADVRLQSE